MYISLSDVLNGVFQSPYAKAKYSSGLFGQLNSRPKKLIFDKLFKNFEGTDRSLLQ